MGKVEKEKNYLKGEEEEEIKAPFVWFLSMRIYFIVTTVMRDPGLALLSPCYCSLEVAEGRAA